MRVIMTRPMYIGVIFSCSQSICSPVCLCLRREAKQSSRSWQVSDYNYSHSWCCHASIVSPCRQHSNIEHTQHPSTFFTLDSAISAIKILSRVESTIIKQFTPLRVYFIMLVCIFTAW